MAGIVTVTLNPALDVSTSVDRVVAERKLRCGPPHAEPGGGGLNVSRAIRELGGESLALYLAGGPTGERLHELLEQAGVRHRALPTAGAQLLRVAGLAPGGLHRVIRLLAGRRHLGLPERDLSDAGAGQRPESRQLHALVHERSDFRGVPGPGNPLRRDSLCVLCVDDAPAVSWSC